MRTLPALLTLTAALLVGCTSSSGSPASTDTSSSSYDGPVDQYGVPIGTGGVMAGLTDDPDSASCSDWLAAVKIDQQTAAIHYMDEYNDPQPINDLDSLVSAITTVCQSYGDSETPSDAAKTSISAVYGS